MSDLTDELVHLLPLFGYSVEVERPAGGCVITAMPKGLLSQKVRIAVGRRREMSTVDADFFIIPDYHDLDEGETSRDDFVTNKLFRIDDYKRRFPGLLRDKHCIRSRPSSGCYSSKYIDIRCYDPRTVMPGGPDPLLYGLLDSIYHDITNSSLCLIVGPAGAGKTRAAFESLAALEEDQIHTRSQLTLPVVVLPPPKRESYDPFTLFFEWLDSGIQAGSNNYDKALTYLCDNYEVILAVDGIDEFKILRGEYDSTAPIREILRRCPSPTSIVITHREEAIKGPRKQSDAIASFVHTVWSPSEDPLSSDTSKYSLWCPAQLSREEVLNLLCNLDADDDRPSAIDRRQALAIHDAITQEHGRDVFRTPLSVLLYAYSLNQEGSALDSLEEQGLSDSHVVPQHLDLAAQTVELMLDREVNEKGRVLITRNDKERLLVQLAALNWVMGTDAVTEEQIQSVAESHYGQYNDAMKKLYSLEATLSGFLQRDKYTRRQTLQFRPRVVHYFFLCAAIAHELRAHGSNASELKVLGARRFTRVSQVERFALMLLREFTKYTDLPDSQVADDLKSKLLKVVQETRSRSVRQSQYARYLGANALLLYVLLDRIINGTEERQPTILSGLDLSGCDLRGFALPYLQTVDEDDVSQQPKFSLQFRNCDFRLCNWAESSLEGVQFSDDCDMTRTNWSFASFTPDVARRNKLFLDSIGWETTTGTLPDCLIPYRADYSRTYEVMRKYAPPSMVPIESIFETVRLEQRQATIAIDPFFIDVSEVSGSNMQKFLAEHSHGDASRWTAYLPSPPNGRPADHLDFNWCYRYASSVHKRLPTNAEWDAAYIVSKEYVARKEKVPCYMDSRPLEWVADEDILAAIPQSYSNYNPLCVEMNWLVKRDVVKHVVRGRSETRQRKYSLIGMRRSDEKLVESNQLNEGIGFRCAADWSFVDGDGQLHASTTAVLSELVANN